jgi:hypothetical protein
MATAGKNEGGQNKQVGQPLHERKAIIEAKGKTSASRTQDKVRSRAGRTEPPLMALHAA